MIGALSIKTPRWLLKPLAPLHEAFLKRAAGEDGSVRPHALGAYLVLRMAERFAGPLARKSLAARSVVQANLTYLGDIVPGKETDCLVDIAREFQWAAWTTTSGDMLRPLTAYARWLDGEDRRVESIDVLETALRTCHSLNRSVLLAALLLSQVYAAEGIDSTEVRKWLMRQARRVGLPVEFEVTEITVESYPPLHLES